MGIDYRQVALLFLISGLITFFVYKKTKSKGMALLAFVGSFIVTYILIHKYYNAIVHPTTTHSSAPSDGDINR